MGHTLVGSPRPRSVSDRSVSFKCVDYSSTSNHGDDDGGVTSDIDAYKESYFASGPNTSKHSHFRLELETVIFEIIPPPTTSTGPSGILVLHMVLIYDLHLAIFLALIYYTRFVDVDVQLGSLPGATIATLPPPVAASIEDIASSSSTDHDVGPSTRVPSTSKASLMFSFEEAGSSTGNVLEESLPSEFASITTIINSKGPPSKIPE